MKPNQWYIAKENKKDFKNKVEKSKRGSIMNQMRYKVIIFSEIIRKQIGDYDFVEYAKINVPFIGEFYIEKGTVVFESITQAIDQKDENYLHNITSELIENIKSEIDVFELIVSMLSYAERQKKNAELCTKAEMQRQFRELLGIEE